MSTDHAELPQQDRDRSLSGDGRKAGRSGELPRVLLSCSEITGTQPVIGDRDPLSRGGLPADQDFEWYIDGVGDRVVSLRLV